MALYKSDGTPIEDSKPVSGANGLSCNINDKDLNTIVDSGFYYGNNVTNGPNGFKYVYVISVCHSINKKYSTQIAFVSGSSNTMFFLRTQYNGEWRDWEKVQTTNL